jgi:hypothetical protein
MPGLVQLVDDAIVLHHDTAQYPVSGLTNGLPHTRGHEAGERRSFPVT